MGGAGSMATKDRVLALVERGMSYEQIGLAFDLPPGLLYLIATGLPADGSGGPSPEDLERPGVITGSTQQLVNPRVVAPDHRDAVRQWLRGRARLDAAMAGAARRHTAGLPEGRVDGSEAGGTDDVAAVLTRSHDEVMALLRELEAVLGPGGARTPDALARRASLVDAIVLRLSAHEAAEELIFWPAVRDSLLAGESVARVAREQEREAKEVLHDLGRTSPDEDRFDDLVSELDAVLRRHVAFEDSVLLQLGEALAEEQRLSLGRRVAAAMVHGPTRPHPHAPSGAALLHLAAPAAGALDRLRDKMGRRPAYRDGRADSGVAPVATRAE